ncbi:Hpt domain-containing protein [Arthrobacter sp. MDT1-65]
MIPALDATAFSTLVEDVDLGVAVDFLTTFNALLVSRIARIELALEDHDEEEICTALLSLHSSAAMVGASQLQASAARALTQHPVGSEHCREFVLTLQGQADTFRDAVAGFPVPAIPATAGP